MIIRTLLFILFFNFAYINAQTALNPSLSYKWDSDSTIIVKARGTNFKSAYLINLNIYSDKIIKDRLIYKKDSALIGKGVFQNKFIIHLEEKIFPRTDSILLLSIHFESLSNRQILVKKELKIVRPNKVLPSLVFSDSSLTFKYSGKDILSSRITVYLESSASNKEHEKSEFSLKKDTTLFSWELIKEKPFQKRTFVITINDKEEQLLFRTIQYRNGRFKERTLNPSKYKDSTNTTTSNKAISLNGELYIENNAFSDVPEHSNGLNYPNTIFKLSNTVSIYGIPFRLNAHHTTNDNINPNFRNFFSFSLDVNAYRNQMREQLMSDERVNQYSIPEINNDIELNTASIDRLTQTKKTLSKYPNEKIELDSLLNDDVNQLISSELKDTSFLSVQKDSLFNKTDSILLDSNINSNRINEINSYINRLEASNRYKEQLKAEKLSNTNSIDRSAFDENKLFQKVQDNGVASLFLRFEKLEIGNFYQYAGKYSIRDVEMVGFNTEFLLDPTNKISFLRGKINNFQAFNLDELENNIQVTSVGLTNTKWEEFSPNIRVSEYDDKSINAEDGGAKPKNYVTTFGIIGEIKSFLFYEAELNRSASEWSSTISKQEQFFRNTAIYGKVEVSPFDFLDLNVKYDRVGANYQSEGVFFLIRDMQSYSLGSHLKLFKNKIYFKNDYTLISRNVEQDELTNDSRKLFFDLGSRFRRIPNFQIIHAPISVDIANKLDTAFTNLDAFSSVTIARVFYVKKVKKTVYNTALIYSEILNDYFEGTNKQRGFQHFIGISNPKAQLSFTSSYSEVFEKVRFISSNLSHQLKEWVRGSLYFAKNFQDDRYSEIIRIKFDLKLGESILFGFGGAALFEKNRNTNLGSTVSLRYVY